MDDIARHIAFVNEQIAFQDRMARKYEGQEWRRDLHLNNLKQMSSLSEYLLASQQREQEAAKSDTAIGMNYKNMMVTADDLDGLPEELVKELNISESDKVEFEIVRVIKNAGGILSLDKLIIDLYRKTGDVNRRTPLISRLYRMSQKGLIYSVPNRKGFYATRQISEPEAKRIFGADNSEQSDAAE